MKSSRMPVVLIVSVLAACSETAGEDDDPGQSTNELTTPNLDLAHL